MTCRHVTQGQYNQPSGPDGISAHMLKATALSIAYPLCKTFNLSLNTGKFPSIWKLSSVVPILKTKDTSNPNPGNYRPISLLLITSKMPRYNAPF